MDTEFWETDAGKFISRAKCFLEAAGVLDNEMADRRKGMLFTPTLHLVGHGMELLLKGCMIHNGLSKEQVVSFGHRVNEMWEHDQAAPVRIACLQNAWITHQTAVDSGRFPDAEKVTDPVAVFEEYRTALGKLHSEPKHYPIRYPTDDERVAPKTPLLVGTLWRTADDYVKRYNEFLVKEPAN
jgi:hypothetical protein